MRYVRDGVARMNVKEGTGVTADGRETPRRTRLFVVSLLRFAVVRAGTVTDKTSMLDIMRSASTRGHARVHAAEIGPSMSPPFSTLTKRRFGCAIWNFLLDTFGDLESFCHRRPIRLPINPISIIRAFQQRAVTRYLAYLACKCLHVT